MQQGRASERGDDVPVLITRAWVKRKLLGIDDGGMAGAYAFSSIRERLFEKMTDAQKDVMRRIVSEIVEDDLEDINVRVIAADVANSIGMEGAHSYIEMLENKEMSRGARGILKAARLLYIDKLSIHEAMKRVGAE